MNKKLFINQCIVLFMMFGFKYLPPFGAMTELGMAILGIFVGAIYGWITIDMLFPNIAGIIALGFSGAYPSFVATFQATFANDSSVMMIGCLFVCAFMEMMNLTDVIVGFLLNMRIAKKNIVMFFILFYIAVWLVSALSTSVLAAYLFVVMYRSMTQDANMPPHTKTNSFVLCGIGLVAVLGDLAFPFKPTAIAVMGTLESFIGEPFSFGSYLLYCTSFQFILLILYVLIGRFIIRVDFSKLKAYEAPKVKATKQQKIGLWCILVMMLAFIMLSTNLTIFKTLGLGGISLATMLVMVFIQVDGKPLLDIMELTKKFNWPIYFLICFFMGIAAFLGSPDVGLTTTFQLWLEPVLTIMPPTVFVCFAMIFATILTNFLNNMPVAVIFISLMFAMGDVMEGINLTAACLGIIMASFAACATPAANPVNATCFSHTDLIKPSTSILIGSICCGLLCLICMFIYYPILSFIV